MSIWQTASWGKFLVSSGQAEEVFDVSGIQVEKRKVALGEYGLFALGVEKSLSSHDLQQLEQLCKKQNCLFTQIETLDYGENKKQDISWEQSYYKKFITPYTVVIDLEKSEDEILAEMKPKGRYNIKLARKKGVEIYFSDGNQRDIESFYKLMQATTARDSFAGNNLSYYTKFLLQNKTSQLLLAKVDNKIIAGGIFVFEKEVSIYYYGASTSDKRYRNLMAPYLLQWEAIIKAKSNGSKLYDFLGVATPGDNDSELKGVTGFKTKLTPDTRKVSGSFLYINKKFKYLAIQMLRKIKK